tara:strand:- start:134 stop:568 length:435 start_codon:yes stop_codon:yes gene_type:complete
MAKMTRSELKGIVKECLVEILSEGIGTSSKASRSEKRNKKRVAIQSEEKRLKEHRQRLETRVNSTVSAVTEDPMMQEILQQTAMTTLQEQLANEVPGGAQPSSLSAAPLSMPGSTSAAGINLDSIFSSPKENWSELAFTENKTS